MLTTIYIWKKKCIVPADVDQFYYVKIIEICDCDLNNIPKELGNTRLVELSLHKNKIEDITPITSITSLEGLNVSNNRIKKIPKNIKGLSRLQNLDLSFNNIRKIPLEICELVELYSLSFYKCPIIYLPEGLSKLTEISALDIGNYNLSQNIIPTDFFSINKHAQIGYGKYGDTTYITVIYENLTRHQHTEQV